MSLFFRQYSDTFLGRKLDKLYFILLFPCQDGNIVIHTAGYLLTSEFSELKECTSDTQMIGSIVCEHVSKYLMK